jgi:hypothetical protein
MQRSEQIGDLIASLAKAQMEFGTATKDSDNPYYGSKYADLAAVINAVRPALSKHSIALMQFNEADLERQTASVTTSLHHGEQFISITAEAPAVGKGGKDKYEGNSEPKIKFDVQTIGAAWSYLRRYTLQAITGLASEDDDGNSLQNENKPIPRKVTAPPSSKPQEPAVTGPFLLADDMLQCVILGVTEKLSKKNTPYLSATFNGRVDGFNYAFCFHASLCDVLRSAVKKPITVRIAPKRSEDGRSIQYFTVEEVLWLDGVEYENGSPKLEAVHGE